MVLIYYNFTHQAGILAGVLGGPLARAFSKPLPLGPRAGGWPGERPQSRSLALPPRKFLLLDNIPQLSKKKALQRTTSDRDVGMNGLRSQNLNGSPETGHRLWKTSLSSTQTPLWPRLHINFSKISILAGEIRTP